MQCLANELAAQVTSASVVVKGLHPNCHQIDFIGDYLYVIDTYCQKVERFSPNFREKEEFFPLGRQFSSPDRGPERDVARGTGYAHMNSIVGHQGQVYLLLHNGLSSGKLSEVIQTDHNLVAINRLAVPGAGCHNIVFLENGEMLCCDSRGGNIINKRGVVAHVGHFHRKRINKSTVCAGGLQQAEVIPTG